MTSDFIAPLSLEPGIERTDHELLREFVNGSEGAFAALVHRHIDVVYSSALRQVRDAHTAADVTSAVFIILARKAAGLSERIVVAAWLHRTTRYAAMKAVRAQIRRQHYEEEAARMENLVTNEDTSAQWEQVAPLLDDGLTHLAAKDHEAVVLRFFEKKTFPEIATLTGSTEEGARKRVDRAVEKLRRFLAQRGVAIPVAALTATLAANSVQASPLAVAKSISALSATAPLPPLVVQTLCALLWVRLKWVIGSALVLLLATTISFSVFRSQAPTSSPLQTFRLVAQAMNEGDGERWSSLVHVANPEEEQTRTVLASNVVAQAELRRALIQRFGQAGYEASGFPRLLDDTPESQISTAVESITGDRGTVRLPRGSNLKFVRVNGIWKFDFFRTTPVSPARLLTATERGLVAIREVGQQISQGNYKDAPEAWADFQRRR